MQCPGCPAQEEKNGDNPGRRDPRVRTLKIGASCKPVGRAPLQPAEDRETDFLEKRQEKHKRSSGQLN